MICILFNFFCRAFFFLLTFYFAFPDLFLFFRFSCSRAQWGWCRYLKIPTNIICCLFSKGFQPDSNLFLPFWIAFAQFKICSSLFSRRRRHAVSFSSSFVIAVVITVVSVAAVVDALALCHHRRHRCCLRRRRHWRRRPCRRRCRQLSLTAVVQHSAQARKHF